MTAGVMVWGRYSVVQQNAEAEEEHELGVDVLAWIC